jgi:ABC transporter substrate binding protein
MMGRQDRDQGQLFFEFSLDEMIPTDHLLRPINVFATAVLADLHRRDHGGQADNRRSSGPDTAAVRPSQLAACFIRIDANHGDRSIGCLRHGVLLAGLALRNHAPTIYPQSVHGRRGRPDSYGIDTVDMWRRAPTHIDRILKGAKSADLPVQLPTRFELAINLKIAKALGLTVPATPLERADEVIE